MIQDIAPHRLRNEFQAGKKPDKGSLVFVFKEGGLLTKVDGGEMRIPLFEDLLTGADLPDESADKVTGETLPEEIAENYIWLFSLDGKDCFWYKGSLMDSKAAQCGGASECKESVKDCGAISVPEGCSFNSLRNLRKEGLGPQYLFFAAYTAQQLVNWYVDNTYCGRCAAPTIHSRSERAVKCPKCGRRIYPRIIPAVIVGVLHRGDRKEEDRIVLTKYAGRDVPYYALIAGFTEIGETIEETVKREVMEEVGLKVKNLQYYKSQPWAMADDILMGFYCEVDGDMEIKLDRTELKEGGWYTRDEVVLQPDEYSLTNEMMRNFKEGRI